MSIKLYILFCLFFISCGDDNFPETSQLSGLRILAITADKPEINAATTVSLTPLISYVQGGDATLNYTWEACPDPGIAFGAELSCNSAATALKLSGSGSFSASALSGSYYTGNSDVISLNIPPEVFTYLATLNSEIQYNGLDYIVLLSFTDATKRIATQGFKRIRISAKPTAELNQNPTIGAIQFAGAELTSYPSSEGVVEVASLSPAETYTEQTNVGLRSFTEKRFVSWYSSSGEFLFNRTDPGEANTFTPSGSTGVFVAIYRDGRGGVATTLVSF